MNAQTQSAPLNPWPITLCFFFAILVTSVVAFGIYASTIRFDLVSDDYYAREIAYQSQIDRITNTRPLLEEIAVTPDLASGKVVLNLPVAHTTAADFEGNAHFYRPSDAQRDFHHALTASADGTFDVDAAPLNPGLWKVQLTWNVGETGYYFEDTLVVN